ncbi:hypothetical protein Mmc1_1229 [Magnetococcus marinus MC-1]|uniref:Uncharacterized protein n=1 Tax=Magnetococcus marinus (strain ATCC BAA-1437 / JCM 17883 / MC-1) TaxID=156889 RepID=A0L6Z7_MAGMM|nr:hypothetical protein [Magnetococcus marinus]ABK43740.1 hypothetical protein Mmc1_1229 [Magnetococcus marinus MC-1]
MTLNTNSNRENAAPEMGLWAAVLNQAMKDAKALIKKVQQEPSLRESPLFRADVRHMTRYFRSKATGPGSFIFICDLLGMNHEQAAQQIEQHYLRHLQPVQQRTTSRYEALAS